MTKNLLRAALIAATLMLTLVQPAEAGKLRRLVYLNYTGSWVTNLYTTNSLGTITFPDTPDSADFLPPGTPGMVNPPFIAETASGVGLNYGSLIEGYLTAPETGNYTFWLASDDEAQFFMTTDPTNPLNPALTNLICRVPGYSGIHQWTKFPEQMSAPISLEAGKTYYVKILHKQGTGSDYISLGWQTPSGTLQQPMPAWHFQPIRDTRWSEPDAEVITGAVNPRSTSDVSVYDGNWAVVYANVNLDPPVTYQWTKNGADILGATQAYYLFRANLPDHNSTWTAKVTSGATVITTPPAYLYVFQDKPTVVSAAIVPQNPTLVRVVFSEDLDPVGATNIANYTLPGATISSATLAADSRTVTLQTTLLTPTQMYTLGVSGIQDMATPPNLMDPASVSFFVAEGAINFRIYDPTFATDFNGLRNGTTNSASANPTYVNNQFVSDQLITTTSPGWNVVPLRNNYVGQMIGYVTAPTNGQYKFAIASDDQSVLYLGTSELRSSKRQICYLDGNTGRWNLGSKLTQQQSGLITLEAGKRYYIEAVYRDGTGGDGVTVCWQTPIHVANGQAMPTANESVQANTEPFLIPAANLSPFTTFGNLFFKTNLPATLSAAGGSHPVLKVTVDGSLPYNYQWYKNGSPIAGATSSAYTIPFLQQADSGATFQVVVTNNFSSTNSVVTTLTVTADTVKPSVASVGSLFKQLVRVQFSEPVAEISATNAGNYQLFDSANAAVSVSAAALDPSDATVVNLQTAVLPETDIMRLEVRNVADIWSTPNVMNPATNTFRANNFDAVENINNSQPWSVTADGDKILMTAGGGDIWDNADRCVYVYKNVTGNFDYKIQGISVQTVNQWCKMGIMARSTTAANSRNAFVAFTPLTPAQNTYTPQIRDLTGDRSWSSPDAGQQLNANMQPGIAQRPTITYPSWVRLQRVGNTIYYYYSTDGIAWTFWTFYDSALSAEGPLPMTLPLGLAFTSHDTARTADGVLASFSSVSLGPLAFTLQPTNTTVVEGGSTVFATACSGDTPYFYQWRTNGADIVGATSPTLTLTRVPYSWNGLLFSVRVTNPYGASITSTNALLTVVKDNITPTVRYWVLPKINLNPTECKLLYSEPMNAASAQLLANYQIFTEPGNVPLGISAAVLDVDERTVTLTTAAQTAGTTYRVVVNNVTDQACCPPNPVPANSTDYFYYAGSNGRFAQRADGYVMMEAENYQRSTQGNQVPWELRASRPGYSGYGYMTIPTVGATSGGTSISGGVGQGTGSKLEYDINFTLPTTNYTIWIRGWVADDGQSAGNNDSVYLGIDGNLIYLGPAGTSGDYSYMANWGAGGWDWRSDRNTGSDPLTITNLAPGPHTFILWSREDGFLADKICIEPGIRSNAGNNNEPAPCTSNGGIGDPETWDWLVAPPASPTIAITTPTNTQVFPAGANITLQSAVTGPSPIQVVEYFYGTNLLGTATTAPYTVTWPSLPEGVYSGIFARVTDVLGYQVTTATITISVDSTRPVAWAVGSLHGTGIGVYFNDLTGLDPVTATDPANYQVNGGAVQVTGAVLEPDNLAVLLTLNTPIAGPFTVRIANVADRGFGPNVMLPTTLETTVVDWPFNMDVGTPDPTNASILTDPVLPGTAQAIGMSGYYVRAGGHDIWDSADGLHFVGRPLAGDFDVAVRVGSLLRPDQWSKAGIMIREDLEGNSRNHLIATAPTNGVNVITMQWRATKGATSQSIATASRPTPTPIPNAWLRVSRAAGLVTFFWGTNGTTWTTLYSTNLAAVTPPYPDSVYVGLATTSHNNGTNTANLTTAYYLDLAGLAPKALSATPVGASMVLSWPPEFTGMTLQTQANPLSVGLGAIWTPVPASQGTNRVWVPLNTTSDAVFYRLAP